MSVFVEGKMFKGLRNGIVAAVMGLGTIAGAAAAAPILPGALQNEAMQAPIEKTLVVVHHRRPVVVHHRRRPVVVHHHRRPVVVHHHRGRQVCWWSHGRRVCRWR